MTAKLNAKFKHPFEIEYEWMDSIPPDKNGKLRMIVCKVQDQEVYNGWENKDASE